MKEKPMNQREIKFRAWDKDVEEWFYSDKEYDDHFFEFKNGKLICFGIQEDCGGDIYEPPHPESYECESVEQYTGLKDKHGKEIYEGDLIINLSRNNRKPHEVVFGYGCYLGNYRDLKYVIGHELDEISVIGNIHENKDLL